MNWVRLLGPVLGPFTGMIERRVAIKKANQSFGHITQFIAEFNETLSKDLPPRLASSAGVSRDSLVPTRRSYHQQVLMEPANAGNAVRPAASPRIEASVFIRASFVQLRTRRPSQAAT